MKKKLLAVILSAAMLITGCSKDGSEQSSQQTSTTTSTESTTAQTTTAQTTAIQTTAEQTTAVQTTTAQTTAIQTTAEQTTAIQTTAEINDIPAEPEETSAGFSISGGQLLDANGNAFVMRGINHPHSWFASQDETALKAIADTGANTVRIVCGDGQQYNRDSAETLSRLIERCKELEMIAVLEVHDITGKDELDKLAKTVDFWIDVKDALIGNEAYAILNIANEWVGTWESDIWAQGYTSAIPRLRAAGIKNTIMVDAAGWGQYGKSIAEKGMEVFQSDELANTMFSIHMYGSAGKNKASIKRNLTGVTDQGLCVVVGEFGYTHSDGDVDEAYIMEYCTENNIGYLGWSWKGNGGGVEYLDLAKEWDGSVLSEDWGEVLINGENGIRATSSKCSVF